MTTDTNERQWATCAGCKRLRSTLDAGVCPACREAGVRTRQKAPVPTVVERLVLVERADLTPNADQPAPERLHADAALGRDPGTTAALEAEDTTGGLDLGPCGCPPNTCAALDECRIAADEKPRRRWFRRRSQ